MDLCAVDLVLAHLVGLAENGAGGFCTAEHVVLNLLRVLADMTGATTTSEQQVGTPAMTTTEDGGSGCASHEGKVAAAPTRHYGGLDQSNVGYDEEDDEMIFGHEQRNQFQEPTLFARVAAPYLCRALVALEFRNTTIGAAFPESILQGLAGLLKNLSVKLEGLEGLASATWSPGVYDGIVSSAVVAAALFKFFSTRDCCCETYGGVGGNNGGARVVGLVPSEELARAKKSCEDFEAVLGRSEDVHPAVSRAVGFALTAARSSNV